MNNLNALHIPHPEHGEMRGAAEVGEDLKGKVGLKLAWGRKQCGDKGGHMSRGNCGQRMMHQG